jgi:formylglycine-generating enzyme required for sulfatase activity
MRHVRVFLSSPGDVPDERRIVRTACETLGKDPSFRDHLTIEVVSWDDPVAPAPMLANAPPQDSVERNRPTPAECDLTVVILWSRLGTPLQRRMRADGSPYASGTEYEFENARDNGRPVLLYRRSGKPQLDIDDPERDAKLQQWQAVNGFFARFKAEDGSLAGLATAYESSEALKPRIESDLRHELEQITKAVREEPRAAAAARPAARKPRRRVAPSGPPPVPPVYREWLRARLGTIELLGLRLKQGTSVRLGNVYVPLTTAAGEAEPRGKGAGTSHMELDRAPRDPILDRLGRESLLLTGSPGSGKSTFCRWAALVACEGEVPAQDDDLERSRETFPAAFRDKLPLLVRLRDFWDLLPSTPRRTVLSATELEEALARWVQARRPSGLAGEGLAAHFESGSILLLLDGVDEVPVSAGSDGREHHPRAMLLAGLADALPGWTRRGHRILVTSRPYGLETGDSGRLGLRDAHIDDLPAETQALLARRWFRILCDGPKEADDTASALLADVGERDWLQPLAANALLLTAMCVIYGERKRLPQDKFELYDRIVDTVLHNRIEDRARIALVRARLSVVAHAMHTGDALDEAREAPRAEATPREIDQCLQQYQEQSAFSERGYRGPLEAREELLSQTGLLLPRGRDRAEFYHLSLQEFLAALRVLDIEADLRAFIVARSAVPEWRNTLSFLFGAVLFTATSPERAARLLQSLVDALDVGGVGLAFVVADCLDTLTGRGIRLPAKHEEMFRQVCLRAIRGDAPARDRCRLGAALASVGDPRFRADAWFLAEDAMLGFVEVPAGSFTMGSDPKRDAGAYRDEQPAHDVVVQAFYMARWPVTVAQFRAFVDDHEGNAGFVPGNADCLRGGATEPVVNVSWNEALRYCAWLATKLRAWDRTPAHLADVLRRAHGPWHVTLPSEAEWEKAARGRDGWIYPWGDAFDPNLANVDIGIPRPSAIGCFPLGATPAGIEELSGNVWEWTRSGWGSYPYRADDGRETLVQPKPRVVRGGAFLSTPWGARSTCRYNIDPDSHNYIIGFRVVVSPFSSEL